VLPVGVVNIRDSVFADCVELRSVAVGCRHVSHC
jgi:hypothetical protein